MPVYVPGAAVCSRTLFRRCPRFYEVSSTRLVGSAPSVARCALDEVKRVPDRDEAHPAKAAREERLDARKVELLLRGVRHGKGGTGRE